MLWLVLQVPEEINKDGVWVQKGSKAALVLSHQQASVGSVSEQSELC